jgi:hypothetical protein
LKTGSPLSPPRGEIVTEHYFALRHSEQVISMNGVQFSAKT